MPYKAVFIVISATKSRNDFMQASDVFERGKVLGIEQQVTLSYKRRIDKSMQHAGKAIDRLRQACEADGRLVSLISLQYITTDNIILLNNGIIRPYWNKEVRAISTGFQWFMLDDYLRKEGYTVTTDQHRFITDVK